MLSYFDLRKGVKFILDGQPYEVLEFQQIYKAQDMVVARTKIRNLISGKVLEKTFRQSDTFEEAELEKVEVEFLYSHRGKYYFCEMKNPKNRFELTEEQIGSASKFLKPKQTPSPAKRGEAGDEIKPQQSLTGIKFQEKIINVILPIKVQLKVIEAPPGVKGERAQAGTKPVTLETGAKINAPLFIKEGDIIEINTQTGEYVQRIEKG
ncbi:MAG: hypothetical protein QME57_03415 [Patescibacteria group bacterium]|nr:hypothetical protein [Patescibacteria group bacterium]